MNTENLTSHPHLFQANRVSIVTTCMNRNEFLCQSLLTWLNLEFAAIVIVDWNSSTPVADDIAKLSANYSNDQVLVVRSDKHYRKQYFNDGWARNTGARMCTSDFILFLDGDMKIAQPQLFLDAVPLDNQICYRGNIPGGYGSCLVDRKKFNAVNGYSERMWAWGGEDLDLYIRLKLQQGCEIETFFPDELFEHIEHDQVSRVENRLQEWDDLEEGANSQRLEQPKWTVNDVQQKVEASILCLKTNTKSNQLL